MLSRVSNRPIISWSDNRWSPEGAVYDRLGFSMEIEYGPDYSYTNNQGQYRSKQSMQKKHIGAKPNKLEHERAEELGWFRIWDCGKRKWVLK